MKNQMLHENWRGLVYDEKYFNISHCLKYDAAAAKGKCIFFNLKVEQVAAISFVLYRLICYTCSKKFHKFRFYARWTSGVL